MPRRGRKQPMLLVLVLGVLVWAFVTFQRHQEKRHSYLARGRVDMIATEPNQLSRHLVVATLDGDDTSWIRKRLQGWGASIYVANNPKAALTVPVNKGREAQVYLTFIIDNYDNLPDVMCFIHGRQYQWHNDDPNKDGATVLSRVQTPYIMEQGYVNLRCAWILGCPDEVHVNDPRAEHQSEINFRQGFLELFPERAARNDIPEIVGASCCAQFALAAWKVRELPRKEYIRIRKWLTETPLEDDISGRIMEYSWHSMCAHMSVGETRNANDESVIFGKDPIFCPSAPECYCNVFGMCDLKGCADDGCEGMYELPTYSTEPWDWRQLPEYDNISYEDEWRLAEARSRLNAKTRRRVLA